MYTLVRAPARLDLIVSSAWVTQMLSQVTPQIAEDGTARTLLGSLALTPGLLFIVL